MGLETLSEQALPIAIGCGALGLLIVVLRAKRTNRPKRSERPRILRPRGRAATTDFRCTVCQRDLVFTRDQMRTLKGVEVGLAVRSRKEAVGRPLAEYTCPHCESGHCFAVDGREPEWLGANLYQPQQSTGRCMECGRPFKRTPWPVGAHQGDLRTAPSLDGDLGLRCSRCKSVVCVACSQVATRNRTDGSVYYCARCSRPGMDSFYYP